MNQESDQADVQFDDEFENVENIVSSTFGEDWDDSNEPLEPIVNVRVIDPELLNGAKREPREANCKRKLCYSQQFDDGYGCSMRLTRMYRNSGRHLRGRGKRFKRTVSDLELGLSDGEQMGYTSAEDANTEHEMDQETQDVMEQIEARLKFDD